MIDKSCYIGSMIVYDHIISSNLIYFIAAIGKFKSRVYCTMRNRGPVAQNITITKFFAARLCLLKLTLPYCVENKWKWVISPVGRSITYWFDVLITAHDFMVLAPKFHASRTLSKCKKYLASILHCFQQRILQGRRMQLILRVSCQRRHISGQRDRGCSLSTGSGTSCQCMQAGMDNQSLWNTQASRQRPLKTRTDKNMALNTANDTS